MNDASTSNSSRWAPLRAWLDRLRARRGESPEAFDARSRAQAIERLRAFAWAPGVRRVLETLATGGHAAYLVGGSVRDAVLGREPGPFFDVATSLRPDDVIARFPRVEPIGLRHGTVLILESDVRVECTTFRREGAYADARHPDDVAFTDRIEEDLARRDFTVNAMAWDPRSDTFVDPFGGAADLARRSLAAVGDPRARFREDALRPLRAARLSATLEFDLESGTEAALSAVVDRVPLLAMERVREEWVKLLGAPRPSVGIDALFHAGLLEVWMPELARCAGVPQNRWHLHDVYEHSLQTCDAAPAGKPRVRWAALLHDIGKPATRANPGPDATFYGHAELGASLADALLERFRMPNDERAAIVHLIREHMFDYRREWTDAALRRFIRRVGIDAVADLFDLRLADVVGSGRAAGFPAGLDEMRERIDRLLDSQQVLSVRHLALSGEDVMRELGIGPGPRVGAALDALLELVLDAPESNRPDVLRNALHAWDSARGDAAPKA